MSKLELEIKINDGIYIRLHYRYAPSIEQTLTCYILHR
jgi:hypothetical protein